MHVTHKKNRQQRIDTRGGRKSSSHRRRRALSGAHPCVVLLPLGLQRLCHAVLVLAQALAAVWRETARSEWVSDKRLCTRACGTARLAQPNFSSMASPKALFTTGAGPVARTLILRSGGREQGSSPATLCPHLRADTTPPQASGRRCQNNERRVCAGHAGSRRAAGLSYGTISAPP